MTAHRLCPEQIREPREVDQPVGVAGSLVWIIVVRDQPHRRDALSASCTTPATPSYSAMLGLCLRSLREQRFSVIVSSRALQSAALVRSGTQRIAAEPGTPGPLRRTTGYPAGSVKLTRAPPSARFSAQIVPPCASTRPRAIANPRPAPASWDRCVGCLLSRNGRRSVAPAAGEPFAAVSTVTGCLRRPARRDSDAPSEGVWRNAFVRRLRRTRSRPCRGRRGFWGRSIDRDSSLRLRRGLVRRSLADRVDDLRGGNAAGRASGRRHRFGRVRRGRRSEATVPHLVAERGEKVPGSASPSSSASSIAWIRRGAEVVACPGDELRRASKTCSRLRGHLVEERRGPRALPAPNRGPYREFSSDGLTDACRSWSIGLMIQWAKQSSDDGEARMRRNGEDLDVVVHVEHDPSRSENGGERKETASAVRPMSCSRTVGRSAERGLRPCPREASISETRRSPTSDHGPGGNRAPEVWRWRGRRVGLDLSRRRLT